MEQFRVFPIYLKFLKDSFLVYLKVYQLVDDPFEVKLLVYKLLNLLYLLNLSLLLLYSVTTEEAFENALEPIQFMVQEGIPSKIVFP